MKTHVQKIIWVTFLLLALDILLYEVMSLMYLGSENALPIPRFIYWTLKNVLSLPIAVFNGDYPFFLNRSDSSILTILLFATINDLIIASGIIAIVRSIRTTAARLRRNNDKG